MKTKTVLFTALLGLCVATHIIQAATPKAKNKVQIALLLDTSNSMDGLIDQAKAQLWKMVNQLAKAKRGDAEAIIEIALFEYGNDNLAMGEGYVRMVNAMTTDVDDISEKLFALKTKGGSEYCGWAIQDAVNNLQWSQDDKDLKIIVIAGNEPFDQGPKSYVPSCQKAHQKNIIINTVFCGNWKEGINTKWQDGAKIGHGEYFNIEQDRKIVHIPTPYDDGLMKLNEKLNATYIGYGTFGASKMKKQVEQDKNADGWGKANSSLRTTYKAKGQYRNEGWDMVDATEIKPEMMKDIKTEDLPENMRKMTVKERSEYIEKMRAERLKIKKEIIDLDAKMQAYITQKTSKDAKATTLDEVMSETLTKQIKAKGFEMRK